MVTIFIFIKDCSIDDKSAKPVLQYNKFNI